jgi:hypothetical protein
MTHHHLNSLPPGHRARPGAAAALWTSVAGAGAFTVFAYVTTQLHAVRAGSPWQDDPYDTVVTFTMFSVPLLGAITALRALLCRRGEPLPLYRIHQLLRAALVNTLLVAVTLATTGPRWRHTRTMGPGTPAHPGSSARWYPSPAWPALDSCCTAGQCAGSRAAATTDPTGTGSTTSSPCCTGFSHAPFASWPLGCARPIESRSCATTSHWSP